MTDYIFIYKNAEGRFNRATNPRFIDMHKACRAIPTEAVDKHYSELSEFIWELNQWYFTPLSKNVEEIINTTDLKEIFYGA